MVIGAISYVEFTYQARDAPVLYSYGPHSLICRNFKSLIKLLLNLTEIIQTL